MQADVTLSLIAKWDWIFNATPGPYIPRKQNLYKLYRRLVRPQGRD